MERYIPKHPLPEEIQSMERDDTVCQFCGVSYLIHTEIKALEDKLAKTEAELAKLQGSEEREKKLQANLKLSEDEKNLLHGQLQDRDSLMAMLQSENDAKTLEMETIRKTLTDYKGKYESLSLDNDQLRKVISELLPTLKYQKGVISTIKSELQACKMDYFTTAERMNTHIVQIVEEHRKDQKGKKERLDELSLELDSHKSTIQELSHQLKQASLNQANHTELTRQVEDALASRQALTRELEGATNEISVLTAKCSQLEQELHSTGKALKKKSEEFDSVTQQHNLSQKTSDSRIATLSRELNYSENEVTKIKSQYDWLVKESEIAKQNQVEREKAAARSQGETEDMREKLQRVLGDLEAIKLEREQMITAHQNRIEDLRESFKRKMAEADKWPEKMEKSLQRERSKHQAELSALEAGMKENFVMEMQIEKQKHQKLLERLTEESKSEILQLKSQLRSHAGSQSEIEALKLQLKTSKADAQGTEARLRSEIENLKSIINDLEARLGKLDTADTEYVLKLKSQLSDKERDLEDSADRIKTQEDEIARQKEQLQVLQDTVSRECEERMELIDALGEAREQLLHLKKPEGGYASPSLSSKLVKSLSNKPSLKTPRDEPSSHQSPASSRRSSIQAEEMLIYKQANQKSSHQATNSLSSAGSASSGSGSSERSAAKVTNGSGKHIALRPDGNKGKPLRALRSMDSEQKRKIAAILSRTKQ